MEQLREENLRWGCPKCGHSPCTCWSKSNEIADTLARQDDICPGGCGRTKKACQAANGAGCSLR